MIFLINKTGENLMFFAETNPPRQKEETTSSNPEEAFIRVKFPNSTIKVDVLHTTDAGIINAMTTRFRENGMRVGTKKVAAHDFYIDNDVVGYDLTKDTSLMNMVRVVSKATDDKYRSIPRNVIMAFFKVTENRNVSFDVCNPKDALFKKEYEMTIADANNDNRIIDVYRVIVIAIKWVGWHRLQKPAFCKATIDGVDSYYRMTSREVKDNPKQKKDWITPVSNQEALDIIGLLDKLNQIGQKKKKPQPGGYNKKPGDKKPYNGGNKKPYQSNQGKPYQKSSQSGNRSSNYSGKPSNGDRGRFKSNYKK